MKKIPEYSGFIYQLRRLSQEIFGYEFAIIYRVSCMIKDVDEISSHIEPFIHSYLVQDNHIYFDDMATRPFTFSYNLFSTYFNPCRINTSINPSAPISFFYFPVVTESLSFLYSFRVQLFATSFFHF